MDKQNAICAVGASDLSAIRATGRPQDFEVLVDAGLVVGGLGLSWCRVKRLRSSEARFPVEVFLPDREGVGSFQEPEIRAARERESV